MQNIVYLVLLVGSTSALFIQNPGDSTDEETSRTVVEEGSSVLYPLLLNPFQVSNWNCFGTTFYNNTALTEYTYSVDVCITGLIGAKLLFPWFYQIHTGECLFEKLGLDLPFLCGEDATDEYGAPVAEGYEGYAAPAEYVDEYGAPAYEDLQESYGAPKPVDEYGAPAYQETYGAPKPVYGSYEQRRNGKTPSFRERLSIAYKDLSKAIKKNNPLNNFQ